MTRTAIEPGTYRWMGFLVAVCALLLMAQSWRERYAMNPDGMSYLDLADRLLLGDGGAWLHPYWSPLYPGLLAVTFKLIPPDAATKFPLAHLLNCVIGLAALAAFTFFLMQWMRLRGEPGGDARPAVLFGYACFLWSSIEVIGLQTVSPDLLVSALLFLAGGLVCSMGGPGDRKRSAAVWLGIVLGLAFLAKAVMLVLGAVFLVLLWTRVRRSDIATAAVVFALIAGVHIGLLSARLGKVSFSESGRLNYAWFVQEGIPLDYGWTGEDGRHGTPLHPPRRVGQQPEVLEFNYSQVQGTYPLWYDPAFFHEGLELHFDAGKQLAVLASAPSLIRWSHGRNIYVLLAGLLALAWFARRGWGLAWRRLRENAWLVLWPLTAMAVYGAVFVTPRYLGPFLVFFWMGSYDALRGTRAAGGVYILAALLMAGISVRAAWSTPPAGPTAYLVSQELNAAGLKSGDLIATLGKGVDAYYAHLAQLRIIADIDSEQAFWNLPQAEAEALEQTLRQAGARAIVSQHACPASAPEGWRELPQTGTCLKVLTNPR